LPSWRDLRPPPLSRRLLGRFLLDFKRLFVFQQPLAPIFFSDHTPSVFSLISVSPSRSDLLDFTRCFTCVFFPPMWFFFLFLKIFLQIARTVFYISLVCSFTSPLSPLLSPFYFPPRDRVLQQALLKKELDWREYLDLSPQGNSHGIFRDPFSAPSLVFCSVGLSATLISFPDFSGLSGFFGFSFS